MVGGVCACGVGGDVQEFIVGQLHDVQALVGDGEGDETCFEAGGCAVSRAVSSLKEWHRPRRFRVVASREPSVKK
ncbi:hypothetical protein GCM10009540_21050 [Streptomyces turgidiscabies]